MNTKFKSDLIIIDKIIKELDETKSQLTSNIKKLMLERR